MKPRRLAGSLLVEASVSIAVTTLLIVGAGRLIAVEGATLQRLIEELRYQRTLTSASLLAGREAANHDPEELVRIVEDAFPTVKICESNGVVVLGEERRDQVRIWTRETTE